MVYLYVLMGGAMLAGVLGLFEFVNSALTVPRASQPVATASGQSAVVDHRLLDQEFLMLINDYAPSWKGQICIQIAKRMDERINNNPRFPLLSQYATGYRSSSEVATTTAVPAPRLQPQINGCAFNNEQLRHRVIVIESVSMVQRPAYFSCSLGSTIGATVCPYEQMM